MLTASIKALAEEVASTADTLKNLYALRDNDIEEDVLCAEPLYEEDDGKVISHISYYEKTMKSDIKIMLRFLEE